MTPPVTFTLDIEDYAPAGEEVRAPAVTRRVVERLTQIGVRGTMFVVGELANEHRSLVTDLAAAGHEIGLHAWRHVPLPHVERAELRDELRRGKDLLEDLTGAAVHGFRAPMFSLVPESRGVLDDLVDIGFTYSSSVLPARSPLWGDATAPRHPFRWPNGLLELPCPVATFGRIANPYLGGVYFRVLPWPMIRYGISQSAADELLWLYCHPYDFDPDEPFRPREELGRMSRLMWVNRKRMLARVERLMRDGPGAPLAERAAQLSL